MTLAWTPFVFVKTNSSTTAPSAVLPNACFSTPAFIFAPPFAFDSAALPDEFRAHSKRTLTPMNLAALMEALLIAVDPAMPLRGNGNADRLRNGRQEEMENGRGVRYNGRRSSLVLPLVLSI